MSALAHAVKVPGLELVMYCKRMTASVGELATLGICASSTTSESDGADVSAVLLSSTKSDSLGVYEPVAMDT